MRNKSTRGVKILYIAISVLIAVGIWAYVDSDQNVQVVKQISDIPIEFIGENTTLADRGLMLLSSSETTVTLRLEGNRKIIAQLDPNKVRAQADLSDITSTGTQSISIRIIYPSTESIPSTKFANNLTLVKSSSYSVSVDIGELYSRNVEIRCQIQGVVAEGYIAGEVQFQPKALEIRGEQEYVDQVSYAKVTLSIDNASESVTKNLDYTLYDQNDREIDMSKIHTTVDQIQVTLPVNVVKELPLTLNFIESAGSRIANLDYSIEPKSITVSGAASALDGISSIVLDDFDLSELNGAATYNYVITVPDGCENLSGVTRAKLQIAFRDLSTVSLNAVRFEAENVPEGKSVQILTSELAVELRGTAADVAAVTPENLTLVADLSDVSSASGSYTVPATVRVDTAADVGVVGTYQVKITISDNEG